MTLEELRQVLKLHERWLANSGGRRAHLEGADLRKADLTGAYLFRTDFMGANLTGTNLTDANLKDAVTVFCTGLSNYRI